MDNSSYKALHGTKSHGKYNPPKVSHWEEVRFHCSPEWHFTWMTSRLAFTLYSWGRGLSFKTESFYPSQGNIAGYFDCDRTTVLRALKELVRHGWAEVLHKEPGKTVRYRFISHEDWATAHPDCCLVKETMPYEGQGDPLGRQLHAISGGLARFKPNQMTGLRRSGLPDDQIAAEFSVFLEQNPQKGKEWESVYYHFRKHILRLSADLRNAADAKNSSSDQLHRSNTHQLHRSNTPCCTGSTPTCCTEATQVFEVEFPKKDSNEEHDTAKAARAAPHPEILIHGRGKPPSKPSPEEKTEEDRKYERRVLELAEQKRRLLEKYPSASSRHGGEVVP